MLNDDQRNRFLTFKRKNQVLFDDRVMQEFFSHEPNIELLLFTLEGDCVSKQRLEENFRKHFFRIRFVKYLVSTIKFCAIDQFRANQRNDTRHPLIFDQPTREEQSTATLGELLSAQVEPTTNSLISDPEQFIENISNEALECAYSQLTPHQKVVITLGYGMSYRDNEIAKLLGVSPQAVGKSRNSALKKMRASILNKEVI
ncbi:sigma-70 family RNA polymerase sigma factor [Paenibacillus arenosi]|uniref:Sigma-70 family RNA polymerase sigma factor n=1 Tax=Paenibacillus arenosi TaxID=2774142 RepID=A0ABR9B418_9BACL|nr:sigma-70 family RNA polymerase sigma factor [Paenibacillus arenosi]MBD8501118.1 sigma-70 family RNA polymerase sigma factor [Paenibacillus arenosi]